MPETTKNKAIKGIYWHLIERFGVQGVKIIISIILARLLTPKDFGIIGLILSFIAISKVIVESGLGKAYIQKKSITANRDGKNYKLNNKKLSKIKIEIINKNKLPFD